MDIIIEKKTTINDETDWLRVAPPKGGIAQWKDGYSAKEFARFVTISHDSFSKLIKNIVNRTIGYVPESLIGEPEATTDLPPKGSSGPRSHDLLLFDDKIVIGIEAKVKEPFGDKTLQQESKTNSSDKKKRIEWLIDTILPKGSGEEAGDLEYQLLTATAGTLLEAYDKGKEQCIFLVLSFHKKGDKPNSKNEESFNKYVDVICGKGKVCKEFLVKREEGDKERKIQCWFIKQEISFTPQTFNFCP